MFAVLEILLLCDLITCKVMHNADMFREDKGKLIKFPSKKKKNIYIYIYIYIYDIYINLIFLCPLQENT